VSAWLGWLPSWLVVGLAGLAAAAGFGFSVAKGRAEKRRDAERAAQDRAMLDTIAAAAARQADVKERYRDDSPISASRRDELTKGFKS